MAHRAKAKWKLVSLEVLGDPSLSLARHLKATGLLDVCITMPDEATDPWTARHPYMSYYSNGCAQPATLVISREAEVWFAHTVVPSRSNGGGAVDRPFLGDVWQTIKQTKLCETSTPIRNQIRKQTLLDGGVCAFGICIPLPVVFLGAALSFGTISLFTMRAVYSYVLRSSVG